MHLVLLSQNSLLSQPTPRENMVILYWTARCNYNFRLRYYISIQEPLYRDFVCIYWFVRSFPSTIQLTTFTASSRSVIYQFKNIFIDCVCTCVDFVESIYLLRGNQRSSSGERMIWRLSTLVKHIPRLHGSARWGGSVTLRKRQNGTGCTLHVASYNTKC